MDYAHDKDAHLHHNNPREKLAAARNGIATIKIVLLLPLFITLLALVLEIGNLWLARIELENALESAALAAVKEWGDNNGAGGTFTPRNVGNEFGKSNTVADVPMNLGLIDPNLNFDDSDPVNNPNQNLTCPDGVLIFGAITSIDPEVVFNAAVVPNCLSNIDMLFDVTEQGNSDATDNGWGISFRANNSTFLNDNLLVTRILIDVDPFGTGEAFFDLGSSANPRPAVLSDNFPQPKVRDSDPTPPNSQPDNFGFAGSPAPPTNQVLFSPSFGTPTILEINFNALGDDRGFSPGDRFRFGTRVRRRRGSGGGFGVASGDDIGQIPARVTVFFQLAGTPLAPATGFFFDNREPGLDARRNCNRQGVPFFDPLGNRHLVVHGRQIPDLPCPATSAANNNGQSFVTFSTTDARPFAVRAQAEVRVPSIFENLFGWNLGPYFVSAKSTAYYDCQKRRPILIRIDQFLCEIP